MYTIIYTYLHAIHKHTLYIHMYTHIHTHNVSYTHYMYTSNIYHWSAHSHIYLPILHPSTYSPTHPPSVHPPICLSLRKCLWRHVARSCVWFQANAQFLLSRKLTWTKYAIENWKFPASHIKTRWNEFHILFNPVRESFHFHMNSIWAINTGFFFTWMLVPSPQGLVLYLPMPAHLLWALPQVKLSDPLYCLIRVWSVLLGCILAAGTSWVDHSSEVTIPVGEGTDKSSQLTWQLSLALKDE